MTEKKRPVAEEETTTTFREWAAADRAAFRAAGRRSYVVAYLARCEACEEYYCPSGEEIVKVSAAGEVRVEHYGSETLGECGGFGLLEGSWG
jgi:hypothetical protein